MVVTLIFAFCNVESKGQGANMLKKSNKRKRTRAQIEEEKQQEVLKKQKLASDMAELATLRLRIEAAE